MRRVRRYPPRRFDLRAWATAVLAVASLLFAPVLVGPAHADRPPQDLGCGMEAPVHAMPTSPGTRDRGAACAAACAVCAQLAPVSEEPPPAAPRAQASVRYVRAELRLAGVEPDRGTPPPR